MYVCRHHDGYFWRIQLFCFIHFHTQMATNFRATNTNLSYSLPFFSVVACLLWLSWICLLVFGQCVTNMRMKRHQKKSKQQKWNKNCAPNCECVIFRNCCYIHIEMFVWLCIWSVIERFVLLYRDNLDDVDTTTNSGWVEFQRVWYINWLLVVGHRRMVKVVICVN